MSTSKHPESPPATSVDHTGEGTKERRLPSVTPRKFRRFFTPRSQDSITLSSRMALENITSRDGSSRNRTSSGPIRPFKDLPGLENTPPGFSRGMKRRKIYHTPEQPAEDSDGDNTKHRDRGYRVGMDTDIRHDVQPIPSSPCERVFKAQDSVIEQEDDDDCPAQFVKPPVKPIRRIEARGLALQLLQLHIGATPSSKKMTSQYPADDWQNQTRNFYSKPADVHMTTGIEGPHRVIPFCTASCNTNSLVAVGDEEGRVRLLESTKAGKPSFGERYLAFRVHTNAIIDMAFSEDDSLLATASGDQTARVVDMYTQTTLSVLGNHSASLKQVRFQPGANNNSVLATSSRDSCVQIWDLRCRADSGPRQQFHAHVPGTEEPPWGKPIYSIYDAHKNAYFARLSHSAPGNDLPARGELPGRIGDMSVTAMSFLAQDHLLVTGSEGDASIKLWDLRSLHSNKRKTQVALSQTVPPESHSQWRPFGTSSINVSGDGSRFYTLCKDNTVYAYSTAHLILGQASALDSSDPARRLPPKEIKEGLGPLYGYRHPQLHATSFYVKSALRRARGGKCEVLAVGSSDGCAILFPTDERYLPAQTQAQAPSSSTEINGPRTALRRTNSSIGWRINDELPISTNGTPLIRGHDREVGSLAWTSEGNLVTVGDDFLVRAWREDSRLARDLRMGGEGDGRRWASGWADVAESADEDDD
ncbi:WD40-repeat-containing domain protein [Calycina marina]|uniref:WD40-repeat-containing domain protein n=1 Tax=Calycina marina TaxID=1763456 RepID=A0A9P7YY89_9HELO|nr:WD40-repeat-containing domain protein [Calycina marina]